jgi:DNA-binding NarL/FixJ family response regulator
MHMPRGRAVNSIEKHTPGAGTTEECGGGNDGAELASVCPGVYIISDIRLFREGLAAMLSRESTLEVIGHGSCSDALEAVRKLHPELVLLDITGHDALAVPRQLRLILPALRIVAVAVAELEADVIACAEAGICGYVAQNGTMEHLIGTLMRALSGELICPPRITALLFDRVATLSAGRPPYPLDGALTPREREIAELIARGLQNKQIANYLCLGNATVKNHVHNILQKLNIQRRGEIVTRRFKIDTWRESSAPIHSRRLQSPA